MSAYDIENKALAPSGETAGAPTAPKLHKTSGVSLPPETVTSGSENASPTLPCEVEHEDDTVAAINSTGKNCLSRRIAQKLIKNKK